MRITVTSTLLICLPFACLSSSLRRRLENPSDAFYETPAVDVRDAFWVFGTEGVHVYAKDGSSLLHRIDKQIICGGDCNFRGVTTDRMKYVFATETSTEGYVQVFGIDNGRYLGRVNTCGSPVDLDYAPHREEVWVHCWSPSEDGGDEGHVDIFSTNARGLEHQQVNIINGTLESHGHGTVVLDASVPQYAWATLLESATFAKIDAQTKELVIHDMSATECYGFAEMAIASGNKHGFIRCHVCCSCGVDGDTQAECSNRARSVTLRDGTTAQGHCGRTCEGSLADTIGVLEYDLMADEIVTTHFWQTVGAAKPQASNDGNTMAFLGDNGGFVRLLDTSGETGRWSSDYVDVSTGFAGDGSTSDVEFVGDHRVVFTSTGVTAQPDNYVVIADVSVSPPATKKIVISDSTEQTAQNGRGGQRLAKWAHDSNFVLVNGELVDELYFIDLGESGVESAYVKNTIQGVMSKQIVYVPAAPDSSTAGQSMGSSSMKSDDDDNNDYLKDDYKPMIFVGLIVAIAALSLGILNCILNIQAIRATRNLAKSASLNKSSAPTFLPVEGSEQKAYVN